MIKAKLKKLNSYKSLMNKIRIKLYSLKQLIILINNNNYRTKNYQKKKLINKYPSNLVT